MLGTFYIKYVQIFRNLEAAYDQIVHPQKRLIIRQVLDGVMGRILELKNEMVELEYSEFHYIDDILQDLKLAPDSIDIPIPRYFIKEKLKVLKERERILAQILMEAGLYDDQPKKRVAVMVLEEAIRLIQISERARQGRLRATFMKQIYLEEKRERQAKLQGGKGPDVDSCAVCIQKLEGSRSPVPAAAASEAAPFPRQGSRMLLAPPGLANTVIEPRVCCPPLPFLAMCWLCPSQMAVDSINPGPLKALLPK
ncbi:UNVERIFIED_CONTAM: Dynein regulatory complex protein 11 [Gekko kuhli]